MGLKVNPRILALYLDYVRRGLIFDSEMQHPTLADLFGLKI